MKKSFYVIRKMSLVKKIFDWTYSVIHFFDSSNLFSQSIVYYLAISIIRFQPNIKGIRLISEVRRIQAINHTHICIIYGGHPTGGSR